MEKAEVLWQNKKSGMLWAEDVDKTNGDFKSYL